MAEILPHSASSENSAYFAAHLHTRSGCSYGQGVAYPDELAQAAVGMGYRYLALTDRDGMYGVPKFLAACAEYGISPIVGAEITVEYGKCGEAGVAEGERGHLVLLCESMEGYASLCKLITRYRTSRVFRTAPAADGDHPSENLSSHPSAKERRFSPLVL